MSVPSPTVIDSSPKTEPTGNAMTDSHLKDRNALAAGVSGVTIPAR